MKRLATAAGMILATLGLFAAVSAVAEDEKTPTIKEVMTKLHKGAKSPLAKLKNALKSDTPDWDSIQKSTKDFVILGAALAKNDPPKGDPASWQAQSTNYYTSAKALDDAASSKNLEGARAAHKALANSCKNCHAAHKGK